jgi:uncharacterized Tic20 family protein
MADVSPPFVPPPPPPASLAAPYEPAQDERTHAMLACALLVVGGWIPALIIFFIKSGSKFVRFYCTQIMLLSAVHIVTLMIMLFCMFFVMFFTIIRTAASGAHPEQFPLGFFIVMPFFWLFSMFWWVVLLVVAIVYAIKASNGQWAEIPLLGRWAKKMLKIAPATAPH